MSVRWLRMGRRWGAWLFGGGMLLWLGLGAASTGCGVEPAACDAQCQADFFACFRAQGQCSTLCDGDDTAKLSCKRPADKDNKPKLIEFTKSDCGRCLTAWELWSTGSDCKDGDAQCVRKISDTGQIGFLLQKCVRINERWTWSSGRSCQKTDPYPCVAVGDSYACLGCSKDEQCEENERCDTNKKRCIQCTQDADCKSPMAKYCAKEIGRCVGCLKDAECRPSISGRVCKNFRCMCISDQVCQQAGALKCEAGSCRRCKRDADCPQAYFGAAASCKFGFCRARCNRDADCSRYTDGICINGGCLPGCYRDEDCKVLNFSFCQNRRCRQCLKDTDCTSSLRKRCEPTFGRCVQCYEDQHCPRGFRCSALVGLCRR